MSTEKSSKEQISSALNKEAFPITTHKELLSSFICGPDEPVCIIGETTITPAGISEIVKLEHFPFEDAEKLTEYLEGIYGTMDSPPEL